MEEIVNDLPRTLPWGQGLGSEKVYCWRASVLVDLWGRCLVSLSRVSSRLRWQVPTQQPPLRLRGWSRCHRPVLVRVAGHRHPRLQLPPLPPLPGTPPTVVGKRKTDIWDSAPLIKRRNRKPQNPASASKRSQKVAFQYVYYICVYVYLYKNLRQKTR